MPAKMRPKGSQEYQDWLEEIITLAEAAMIRKVSIETLRREGRSGRLKILKLSPRRQGIKRREAMKGLDFE